MKLIVWIVGILIAGNIDCLHNPSSSDFYWWLLLVGALVIIMTNKREKS